MVSLIILSTCSRDSPCRYRLVYGRLHGSHEKGVTYLCFWHQEVGVDESTCAKTTPDEEHARSQISFIFVDHVGGNDGNNSVPQPVRGGGKGDTSRSDGQWEHFSDDNLEIVRNCGEI